MRSDRKKRSARTSTCTWTSTMDKTRQDKTSSPPSFLSHPLPRPLAPHSPLSVLRSVSRLVRGSIRHRRLERLAPALELPQLAIALPERRAKPPHASPGRRLGRVRRRLRTHHPEREPLGGRQPAVITHVPRYRRLGILGEPRRAPKLTEKDASRVASTAASASAASASAAAASAASAASDSSAWIFERSRSISYTDSRSRSRRRVSSSSVGAVVSARERDAASGAAASRNAATALAAAARKGDAGEVGEVGEVGEEEANAKTEADFASSADFARPRPRARPPSPSSSPVATPSTGSWRARRWSPASPFPRRPPRVFVRRRRVSSRS